MAAVAMIVGDTDDLQLGFPSAYQSEYAAKGIPQRAFPVVQHMDFSPWEGDDLQAQWHQQKLKDAQYMSGAKVKSTQDSIKRAYTAAHHEPGRPAYVLGQRLYANPSSGAFVLNSNRQAYASAPFHFSDAHNGRSHPSKSGNVVEMEGSGHCCDTFRGGVLRSAAGQTHGHNMLQARVEQLNAIEEARQQFGLTNALLPGSSQNIPTTAPFVDSFQQLSTDVSVPMTINLGLQRVVDLLMGADVLNTQESGFRSADSIFAETRTVLSGVIAMGARANVAELSDTLGLVQRIEGLLQASLETDRDDPYMDEYANKTTQTTFITLQEIYKKLNTYLTRMVEGARLQPRDRDTLARSTVKSLGFAKSMDAAVGRSREALSLASRTGTPAARQDALNVASRGHFDNSTERREDTEHGGPPSGPSDAEWGDSNRSQFGWRSGEFYPTNGRSVGWFGADEGHVEYDGAPEDALEEEWEEQSGAPSQQEGIDALSAIRSRAPTNSTVNTSSETSRVPAIRESHREAPIRAFFDPDTQTFNIASEQQPGSRTVSRRGAPGAMPRGLEAQSQGRSVVGLLKGRVGPSARTDEPRARSSNPRPAAAESNPKVAVPHTIADLPDTVPELEALSRALRAQGYHGVPVLKGTTQAPGSAGYKTYIRNVKAQIISFTRG